jgi:hypothetical protein
MPVDADATVEGFRRRREFLDPRLKSLKKLVEAPGIEAARGRNEKHRNAFKCRDDRRGAPGFGDETGPLERGRSRTSAGLSRELLELLELLELAAAHRLRAAGE